MAVEDGTYVVLSALDVTRALDTVGGYDLSQNNVRLWDRNDRDAQIVNVSTNPNGTRMLLFPLTGMALDVQDQATVKGTEVWQFAPWDPVSEASASAAQQFDIVADGGSVTVGGTSYDTHYIEYHKDPSLVVDVLGASSAVGNDVWMWELISGAAQQRWAFVPVRTVPDGTYSVVSAMDPTIAMDVAYNSSANGANVQLWSASDRNSQVFRVVSEGSGTVSIRHAESGKPLDASRETGLVPAKGNNLFLWDDTGGDNQRFLLKAQGTVARQGAVVPVYEIWCKAGTGLVADACGAASVPGTNVWLWDYIYLAQQQLWEFRPAEMYASGLPVPTDVKHDFGDMSPGVVKSSDGAYTVYPSWVGSGSPWEVRYRVRTRPVGKANSYRSAWGPWRSIRNASRANDGWDDAWKANCTATSVEGRWWSQDGVSGTVGTSAGGYDRADIEYQVRRFDADWGDGVHAHGGSASRVCSVAYRPALTVSAPTWTPDGLRVPLSLAWSRGGNSYTLDVYDGDGNRMFETYTVADKAASVTVTIPNSHMLLPPEDGATVTVKCAAVTCDGVHTSASSARTLSYGAGYGGLLSPTVADEDGYRKRVSVGSDGDSRAWIVCDGRSVEITGANGTYHAIYPFGRDYRVFVLKRFSDGTWKTWSGSFTSQHQRVYMWNWDSSWFLLRWGRGSVPKLNYTSDRDYEANLTTGSGYEVVSMGAQRKQPWSVKGVLVAGVDDVERQLDAFDACGHSWFRDPFGRVLRVAVVSVSADYISKGSAEVGVTMRRTG